MFTDRIIQKTPATFGVLILFPITIIILGWTHTVHHAIIAAANFNGDKHQTESMEKMKKIKEYKQKRKKKKKETVYPFIKTTAAVAII